MRGHGAEAAVVTEGESGFAGRRNGLFHYVPSFTYIVVLFIVGKLIFGDPRATLFDIGGYKLSWVEVLMIAALICALGEQLKVAVPGVNQIFEVLLMGAVSIVQIILFVLAAADVKAMQMFGNTEFLLLTIINLTQTVVAFQINAATLVRTISSH